MSCWQKIQPINMAQMNRNGRCKKDQEIQFGPFYKEKGESIWVYTYANYKVEYGIIRDTKRRCLEGKNEGHNFDIEESGLYYVFIRNWSGERTEGGSLVVQ